MPTTLRVAPPRILARIALIAGLLSTPFSLGLGLGGCSSSDDSPTATSDAAPPGTAPPSGDAGDPKPVEPFSVRESVAQLHVTHAPPKSRIRLRSAAGAEIAAGETDELGSYVFREIAPGDGYVVEVESPSGTLKSTTHRVIAVEQSAVERSFYSSQKLSAGSGYIKTRDGTTLSIYVTMPGPESKGPYPTVVDYSGYEPSKPGAPVAGISKSACKQTPALCDAPNDPSGLLAALNGYATVSVNMRGTGCSGGAYDFFETMQLLDGYDMIETVAAQPWVLHNKVGMVGLSYPGITQLFVAKTKPPSLAAISPLSVIGNSATTLLPGGILNDGFALQWLKNVIAKTKPYGQGWEKARVDAGDTVCAENQLLHGQRVDWVAKARETSYYDPKNHDRYNPTSFVDQIEVPVFLASALHDEQTGPFFTTLLDKFTRAPVKRFTIYNGVHIDAFAPSLLVEWKAFLDIYVAKRVPSISPVVRLLAPSLLQNIFHASLTLPDVKYANYPTWEAAKAAFEAERPLRVVFENGAGTRDPGAPVGTFERSFSSWPVEGVTTLRYYFRADGSLAATPPAETDASTSFQLDPKAGQRVFLKSGSVWDKTPNYDWQQPVVDQAVSFVTPPLADDVALLGNASADLYVRSTVADADLQVNLMEVRPDGKEMYVQSGWLRASVRKLGPTSTELWPVPTYAKDDQAPLPPGMWSQVRVPIAATSHIFRKGSRIRVTVDTPGGERAVWRFVLKTFDTPARHSIALSSGNASSIALSRIRGLPVPPALPPCPSLRGQPCRVYQAFKNAAK